MRWLISSLIALILISNGLAESQRRTPRNQPPVQAPNSQPTQPPAADQRGTDQAPLTVKVLPAPGASEKADKEERESHDKAIIEEKLAFETQRIADYTFWLGIFTLAVFVVAVSQAGLFFWQLFLIKAGTRDAAAAAVAAKESADTAKVQAEVARDTLKTMQDTAQRQLRAYVIAEPIKLENFELGKIASADISLKNVGQTPARDVIMATAVDIARIDFELPLYPSFEALQAEPNPRASVLAEANIVTKKAEREFTQKEIDAVLQNRARLYVGGRIYYRDVFGTLHMTDFMYMYHGPDTLTQAAQQCTKGNSYT